MPLRPLSDVSTTDWFAAQPYDWLSWGVAVSLGPPGFEAYARVLPTGDWDQPDERARAALRNILKKHTVTPDQCFLGVWEGYGGDPPVPPADARFSVMTRIDEAQPRESMRDFYLYAGTLDDDAQFEHENNEPHLVWPSDRAWFMAMDTDQVWIGVGGTQALVDELVAGDAMDAIPAAYGPYPDGR